MIKRALAGVVVLAVALLVAAIFAVNARTRQTGERLVAKALAVEARTFERASHRPEPGTLSEQLQPLLAHAVDPAWTKECTQATEPMPEVCEAVWRRERQWAIAVMRSSRAEKWSRVKGLHGLDRLDAGVKDAVPALMFALRVAALEVRKSHDVELCVDALALLRDQTAQGGLVGTMFAAGMQRLLVPPCTDALAAASPEQRAAARAALELVEKSWPASGEWVAYEQVGMLSLFQPVLTDEQRSRMPVKNTPYGEEPSFPERVVLATALPGAFTMFERMEAAASLEPSRRDAELAVIEAEELSSWNPIRRVAAPQYSGFFRRDDDRRDELRRLIASAAQ